MSNNVFRLFPNERYIDLRLIQYGKEQCTPNYSYGPVTRNHFLFHYILSGKGRLSSTNSHGDTKFYSLSPGMGFLIFPDQINTYTADTNNPWEYMWLEFDGIKCLDILASTGLSFDQPIYHAADKELQNKMRNEMLTIIEQENESSLFLIAHLYLFLDYFVRSSFNHTELTGGNLKDLYIREAVTFLEQNYSHSITIEDMAKFCNLNQSYLGKIFKQTLNQTPQQFLIYFRMNKAAEFLKHTTMQIGEISKLVGYPNPLNFSRSFKKIFGVSPQHWREENQLLHK